MKAVRIAELKARLSEYVRHVRRGDSFTVMDRQTPVARLTPYTPGGDALEVREPHLRYPSVQEVPIPPPLKIDVDVVDLLLEERQAGR